MNQRVSHAPPMSWIYDVILTILSSAVHIFFRDVQVKGSWRIPAQGPLILVAAPHSNQFVDSVILMRVLRSLDRKISWLMAEKSFQRKFVGGIASQLGVVPVSRAMDIAKAADGKIYLPNPVNNPKYLKGIGTNFTSPDFEVGGSIYLPLINGESHKFDIAKIIGPEEILIRNAPESSDALFQLTGSRIAGYENAAEFMGSQFKVAPYVNQTQVYEAVFEKLRANGCVGIFPEGASHDRTELLPLKAGVAIIALGALAKGIPITVVPVGLTYMSAHKFRSRAIIEFGDAVSIDSATIHEFKGNKKRGAISRLMSDIDISLKSVTVSAPDFDTLQLIHAARRLYLTRTPYDGKNGKISLSNTTELNRRLSKGYTTYSQTPEMISFTSKLKAYNGSLKALGLKDHQLLSTERGNNYFPVAFLLVRLCSRLSKLILLTTLTLPGLILFAPIFIFTSRMSRKKTAEALANSSVKIKAHDVVATWKILIALILTPLFYNFYAFLLVILHKYNIISNFLPATSSTKAIIALSWIILPFITYASLVFGEQGMDILKSLHPLLLSLDPRSQKVTEKLSRERHDLVRRIKEIVDRYGPDIFPDCEDILVWKERGPKKLYADISPEMEMSELLELNDFL